MTVPLLIGIDGERAMSQTTGNYVGISEPANEMYGKILSIPDRLIRDYYVFLSDIPLADVEALIEESPRDAKRKLAREIVSMYHSPDAAGSAEHEFDRIHVHHDRPTDVPQVALNRELLKDGDRIWIVDLLQASGLVASRGEAKRLIQQGGIKVNDQRVDSVDFDLPFEAPMLVQVGKRSFVELT